MHFLHVNSSKGVANRGSLCGLFLCYFQIGFQGFYVGLEGLVAFGGDAADGARTLAFEGLFYLDVARL